MEGLLVERHRLLAEIAALREESQLCKVELNELEALHQSHAENAAAEGAADDIGQSAGFRLRRSQVRCNGGKGGCGQCYVPLLASSQLLCCAHVRHP